MLLYWTTDIHLNFLSIEQIEKFILDLASGNPDAILISGDIAEAKSLASYLKILDETLCIPIYFVLGNHDYYGSSISRVHHEARKLAREYDFLHWMPDNGVVELTTNTCLIGHGCWADGRLGSYFASPVRLNDYVLIEDLKHLNRAERYLHLNKLGDTAANFIERMLVSAFACYDNVYLLTHVPPFREAVLYNGQVGNDLWMPHFSCGIVGDVLKGMMTTNKAKNLTVLSGHTHHDAELKVLPNLNVIVGGAEYGNPKISKKIEVF